MKVGTIVELKIACLGNLAGTRGVVYYDYGNGFQAIFENGNYDGFDTEDERPSFGGQTEAEYFLIEVGFEPSVANYEFKNVMQLTRDYEAGKFNKALG